MKVSLPEEVERQVAIGLKTGEATDRLLALGMANQADADREYQSQYGSAVAHMFLEQVGLKLEPEGWKLASAYGYPETRQGAAARLAVSRAVGGEIGIRSTFYEVLGRAPGTSYDAAFVEEESLAFSLDSLVSVVPRVFTPDKPLYVEHRGANNQSHPNFTRTLNAVNGVLPNGAKLDEFWTGTLAEIRNLE